MGLFRRNRDAEIRCDAVVVAVQNRNAEGPVTFGTVHLEVHPPGGEPYRATDSGMIRTSKEPQPGMTVPVRVRRDGAVEIEWEEVPTWEERVERGDPSALQDGRERAQAQHEAAHAPLDRSMPGMAPHFEELRRRVAQAGEGVAGAAPAAAAGAGAAPPGWVRGVARVVRAPEAGNPARVQKVVLRVELPGREPYALEQRMRLRRIDVADAGYPVLVSESDREEIEFLWDEVPDSRGQIEGRIEHGFAQADGVFGALQQQQMAQAGGLAQDYAEQALAQITDPEQREAFIRAMRAAGWNV